ncbi:flavonoid 3',5'-hydroxylase 1-like [Canna indica]|uniref:Flavonoid 3',5'-hydroxylase 1-like n=1 Tax=Canna indica TaxID=4628 RepID=A0AAQ3KAZ7_9LILI|nr:flavonoid 3',5'-hydroxylase 1-like [Canna indica]
MSSRSSRSPKLQGLISLLLCFLAAQARERPPNINPNRHPAASLKPDIFKCLKPTQKPEGKQSIHHLLCFISTRTMQLDPFLAATVAACLLLHLLLLRLSRKSSSSRLPLPPGPRGVPILGALLVVGPDAHRGLARLAHHYGPIMYLKMGTSGCVVASNAAAARAFLKTHDAQFANRPDVVSARDITYNRQNMVFADNGPKWKLLRKLCSLHLLGGKALADWAPVRRAEFTHMVRSMHRAAAEGRPVVLPEVMVCALANIVGQTVVSKRVFDAQGDESNQYKDMIVELLTGGGLFNIGDFVPAIAWLDLQGIQAKMRKVHRRFDAMVTKLLEEHEATKDERKGRPDFVDTIMANRQGEGGETITDTNVKAIIFDLFTAGTDTSAVIVEWAVAEMLKNPVILRRLQEEIDSVVGRGRLVQESDLPKLPYLHAVCKEALRLHPSTPLSLPHFSFDDCEVDGYHVPGNTRLLINIWAIGRDPKVWDAPEVFDPERFVGGRTAKIDPQGNDFELIPFGAGRRICAGKLMGMVFVQYMLGLLVHSFDWKLPEGEELNMDERFGLVLPKAVPIKAFVTPRLAPQAYI